MRQRLVRVEIPEGTLDLKVVSVEGEAMILEAWLNCLPIPSDAAERLADRDSFHRRALVTGDRL